MAAQKKRMEASIRTLGQNSNYTKTYNGIPPI
jgi:hypothetical protein